MSRLKIAAIAAGLLALSGATVAVAAAAAGGSAAATCGTPSYDGTTFSISCSVPQVTVTNTVTATATVTVSPSATSPSPTPTPIPTPTPTPSSSSTSSGPGVGYPNSTNTGVPAGVTLTAYTGPMTISQCGTITGVKISGNLTITASNGTTSASTPCVTITDSLIQGEVGAAWGATPGSAGPVVLTDDEVAPPNYSNQWAVGASNVYLERVNLHGGANGGVECVGYCTVADSWIHDFYSSGSTHYDAVISNGNGGRALVIDHNTLNCGFYAYASGTQGGCSADVGLYGDWDPISNVQVTNNLFVGESKTDDARGLGSGFCGYFGVGETNKPYPNGDHITVTGNVFQRGYSGKCGSYGGPVDYGSGTGNVWSGNAWDDGTPIN